MAALRKIMFFSLSNDTLPHKRVCVKEESVDSNVLQSMLTKKILF